MFLLLHPVQGTRVYGRGRKALDRLLNTQSFQVNTYKNEGLKLLLFIHIYKIIHICDVFLPR